MMFWGEVVTRCGRPRRALLLLPSLSKTSMYENMESETIEGTSVVAYGPATTAVARETMKGVAYETRLLHSMVFRG